MRHIPVLTKEILSFVPSRAKTIIDCTVGDAGHAEALLRQFPNSFVLGIDRDAEALKRARHFLQQFGKRAHVVHGAFADCSKIVKEEKLDAVDFLLADLGWSTFQLEKGGRGFSFEAMDEPLDLRMNHLEGISAAEFLNTASEEEIGQALRQYGEEKEWRRIVEVIVRTRRTKKFRIVGDLVAAVAAVKKRHGRLHPATLVFQALRIQVNDELNQLDALLDAAMHAVRSGGRIALIGFHSLEDRRIKQFFDTHAAAVKALTKKSIAPSQEERTKNQASRSAKLRVYEVI